MPRFLRKAGRLVRLAGRLVRDTCASRCCRPYWLVQNCCDPEDRKWLSALVASHCGTPSAGGVFKIGESCYVLTGDRASLAVAEASGYPILTDTGGVLCADDCSTEPCLPCPPGCETCFEGLPCGSPGNYACEPCDCNCGCRYQTTWNTTVTKKTYCSTGVVGVDGPLANEYSATCSVVWRSAASDGSVPPLMIANSAVWTDIDHAVDCCFPADHSGTGFFSDVAYGFHDFNEHPMSNCGRIPFLELSSLLSSCSNVGGTVVCDGFPFPSCSCFGENNDLNLGPVGFNRITMTATCSGGSYTHEYRIGDQFFGSLRAEGRVTTTWTYTPIIGCDPVGPFAPGIVTPVVTDDGPLLGFLDGTL